MNSDVTIVKVDGSHLGSLEAVAEDTNLDSVYKTRITGMIQRDELVLFAAQLEDVYIGRVSLWLAPVGEELPRLKYPGVPFVNALEVTSEYRKRGVALQLMEALEAEVKERGGTRVALGVEPDNHAAIRLYEKLGYVFDGESYESCWDEDGENGPKRVCVTTQLMSKELA